jgi:hypothetical protein
MQSGPADPKIPMKGLLVGGESLFPAYLFYFLKRVGFVFRIDHHNKMIFLGINASLVIPLANFGPLIIGKGSAETIDSCIGLNGVDIIRHSGPLISSCNNRGKGGRFQREEPPLTIPFRIGRKSPEKILEESFFWNSADKNFFELWPFLPPFWLFFPDGQLSVAARECAGDPESSSFPGSPGPTSGP